MNKIYYKGKLRNFVWYPVNVHYLNCNRINEDRLDSYVMEQCSDLNAPCTFHIRDKDIIDILDKNIKTFSYSNSDFIIFEMVKDQNGYLFGKEIKTGLYFPIITDGRSFDSEYKGNLIIYSADGNRASSYDLGIIPSYYAKNPNIAKLVNFLNPSLCEVANQRDVDKYLKKLNTKTFGIKNNRLLKQIKKLSDENVYKDEIIELEEKVEERETQNPATIVMENIEFLLMQINKIDMNLYLSMRKKYNILLQNEDSGLTLSPLTLESLKAFEAELEFILNFQKKNDDNIISCLDNIIAEYESEEKTAREIKDIDKLSSLFLKMKSTYSLTMQRKVIERLALLYIYEIYENKDSIKLEDLSNSYFNDILKSIIICLNDMISNNIIENNIIISIENINATYVLDLIKQIKFVQKEKGMQKQIGDING